MGYDEHLIITCCKPMEAAQQPGTDNEMYGRLIRAWRCRGNVTVDMGCDLPDVRFCPWCGKKIDYSKLEEE